MKKILLFSFLICFVLSVFSQKNISLPQPKIKGGLPLMETLAKRSTIRSYDTKALSLQQLSNLLWAAFGVNRADGKRTAPSSNNLQETELFVLLKTGVYKWEDKENKLLHISETDVRQYSGKQDYVITAPVQVVLVGNISKMGYGTEEEKINTMYIDAGYISQNIYLYCASEGLATAVRTSFDRVTLNPMLKLKPGQQIIVIHSVGYPK